MESSFIISVLFVVVLSATALAIWYVTRSSLLQGEEPEQLAAPSNDGFWAGLGRTRNALSAGIGRAFGGGGSEDERFQILEDVLVASDVGVKTSMDIVESLRAEAGNHTDANSLRASLRQELVSRLGDSQTVAVADKAPTVILMVGVNGSGKTTTIGKLAHRYTSQGKKVLLAAGDTFRAGAIEQLKVWGERVGVPVVAHQEGSDPAAVLFDGIEAGVARGMDVVICDTAGRLQAHGQLMDELGKILRVMGKALPGCPHEVLLVLDATIGQNAVSQARAFKDVVGVTGVVLTKLDGTARGGVVVAVRTEMGLPVKLIGLGEGMDDLKDFNTESFVDALIGDANDQEEALKV
ncbi:MAG: signal recognition particle-docking protein FtsY [Myxococcota bacterium]